jgi:hypothetical protein
MITYADTEATIKTFLLSTGVAPLVRRPDGGYSIYNAMPPAAPNPAVVAFQVSGAPKAPKDFPEQEALIQFDCWGKSRQQAGDIARMLMSELEWLGRTGGEVINGVYLGVATVHNMRWMPEPDSDTPRYIVDALITTVT